MTLPNNYVLTPATNTVFLTSGGFVLGFSGAVIQGTFRFLKDHYVNDEYILAGTIRQMVLPWVPTADVEPLDAAAAASFYAQGPRIPSNIHTELSIPILLIPQPATFWFLTAPNTWRLAGLGSGFPPVII